MKSVGKPKDFSIESILSDSYIFFQNNQCKECSLSNISKTCKIDFQKEKYETNFVTNYNINTIEINTKNNFQSIKKDSTLNLTRPFEIMEKMYLRNSGCRNDKFSENNSESLKQKSEINMEKKCEMSFNEFHLMNSKQYDEKKYYVNLSNIENSTKELEWLRYTRYKPPKVPRKSTIGKNRRKPSLHPRIPFSSFQINYLEQQFQNSAYLSKKDVLKISNILNLLPNRVFLIFFILIINFFKHYFIFKHHNFFLRKKINYNYICYR